MKPETWSKFSNVSAVTHPLRKTTREQAFEKVCLWRGKRRKYAPALRIISNSGSNLYTRPCARHRLVVVMATSVAKETYHVAKETYHVAKETYHVARETWARDRLVMVMATSPRNITLCRATVATRCPMSEPKSLARRAGTRGAVLGEADRSSALDPGPRQLSNNVWMSAAKADIPILKSQRPSPLTLYIYIYIYIIYIL